MLKKLLPHPVLSLFLGLIWLLLNNQFSAGHLFLGAILALIIPIITAHFWQERICLSHPLTQWRFLGLVLWDILLANLTVAKLILGPKEHLQPGFITIDLDIQHPLGISFLANTISLTPGTVSCDLSEDRKQLLVHALHIENPAETIQEIKQRYEQPLMEIFESC